MIKLMRSLLNRVSAFLKAQIQELGVLGFLFASLVFVLCFPFVLLGLLGSLISYFNELTKSWVRN